MYVERSFTKYLSPKAGKRCLVFSLNYFLRDTLFGLGYTGMATSEGQTLRLCGSLTLRRVSRENSSSKHTGSLIPSPALCTDALAKSLSLFPSFQKRESLTRLLPSDSHFM